VRNKTRRLEPFAVTTVIVDIASPEGRQVVAIKAIDFPSGDHDGLCSSLASRVTCALQKDGVERHLQEELAARPAVLGRDLQLVRREWPTDIGPVDLMCRDEAGDWVAVEIKRVGTIDAVEQLTRYLERIELEGCRGVLAAQVIKPQARTLAEARGIHCVEVDLAVLRGEREPELTLFAS